MFGKKRVKKGIGGNKIIRNCKSMGKGKGKKKNLFKEKVEKKERERERERERDGERNEENMRELKLIRVTKR